jgi:phage-related tail fiber protein
MSQHGFGSFAASARSGGDLPSILEALQSGHIGAARPSYVEDGMVWHKHRPSEGVAGTVEKWFTFSGVDYLEGEFDLAYGVFTGVSGSPTGSVLYIAGASTPDGYLKANGASLNTASYVALFAVVGYTFGGSGSSFNLPDLRGEFVRGWDDSRGIDAGRAFGSAQSSANKDHYHSLVRDVAGAATGGSWDGAATDHITSVGSFSDSAYRLRATSSEPNVAASSSEGETDSRPRSIALLACIKY